MITFNDELDTLVIAAPIEVLITIFVFVLTKCLNDFQGDIVIILILLLWHLVSECRMLRHLGRTDERHKLVIGPEQL